MEGLTDKRFRSFLWSQTRKAAYAETRLSVDQRSVAQETRPQAETTPPAEPVPPAPAAPTAPASRSRGQMTPLEKAVLRLSEHCVPPRPQASPDVSETALPGPAEAPHPQHWPLHVQRCYAASPDGHPRLNVRPVP